MNVRLVCGNCGKIEYFESWEAADMKGWDTLERFGYNACEDCPGVSVYLPMLYAQEAKKYPRDSVACREELAKAAEATLEFDPAKVLSFDAMESKRI